MRMNLRMGPAATMGVGGRLMATLFLLAFGGIGAVVGALFLRGMLPALAPWSWAAAQCRVRQVSIEERLFLEKLDDAAQDRDPYRLAVAYEWERDGRSFAGTTVGGGAGYASYGRARRAASAFPPGGAVRCWVDPHDPSRAVLRRPGGWALVVLVVPLVFVLFALAGLVATWRRPAAARARDAGAEAPLSASPVAPARAVGCGVLAFGLFVLFGLGFLVPIFVVPLAGVAASRGWTAAPCRVLYSAVGSHAGSDSTTYSIDVVYEYDAGGRTWRGNRYDFFGGSSSGTEGKQRVVDRLPRGGETTCWYDPDDPSRSVLSRSPFPWAWIALLPLAFVAVGVVGIVALLRGARRRRRALDWLPGAPAATPTGTPEVVAGAALSPADAPADAPYELDLAPSRWGKFWGIVFVTVVWDGIVGVFLYATAKDGRLGHDGCVTLFLVPFVLVGILLLYAAPYQALALLNPRAVLSVSRLLRPGVSATLGWRFRGAAGRLRRLRLVLEGREEAVYRRGTSNTTDRQVFFRQTLVDTTDPLQIATGTVELRLPADTMHSFAAPHNRIVWSLAVKGDVPRFPDVDDSTDVLVAPAELRA